MTEDDVRIAAFLDPARRAQATHELAALGVVAVQVVATVLDGTARNAFGVPYRAFGEGLRGALVTARLLGGSAASLEAAVRSELAHPSATIRMEAAAALGALSSLSEISTARLAAALEDEPDPAMEAAAALLRLKLSDHASVLDVVARSPRAEHLLARTRAWMKSEGRLP